MLGRIVLLEPSTREILILIEVVFANPHLQLSFLPYKLFNFRLMNYFKLICYELSSCIFVYQTGIRETFDGFLLREF